jgi:hypothetical protein
MVYQIWYFTTKRMEMDGTGLYRRTSAAGLIARQFRAIGKKNKY